MVPQKRVYDRHAPRNRLCSTCKHPERPRIEALLAGGASLGSIGLKFGLSKDTLHRHMRRHIHPEDLEILKGAPAALHNLAERAAGENMSILDYLSILRSRLMRQLEASSTAGDNPGVCRATQVMLQVLMELGRLTGEISRATAGLVINNLNQVSGAPAAVSMSMADPVIARLQHGLLKALAPFPEAKSAVVKMLADLEVAEYRPLPNGHAAFPPPAQIEGHANG